MGHTNSTANLALPQFIGTDKPTWLGDINSAFSDIDAYVGTNDAAVAGAVADAASAVSQASSAVSTATSANTTAGNASTTANNAIGVANTANAIAGTVDAKVGLLADLNTSDRTSIVNAINEVYGIVTSNDSVSVTGDGVATYTSKLDDLFALIDPSKINERSILKMGNEVYHTSNIGGSDYQFIGTTISIADGIGGRRIIIKNSGSNFFINLNGTTTDNSNQAVANGSVIKVIY